MNIEKENTRLHSHSIIVESKKFDKVHFKETVMKQQNFIKASIQQRKYSSAKKLSVNPNPAFNSRNLASTKSQLFSKSSHLEGDKENTKFGNEKSLKVNPSKITSNHLAPRVANVNNSKPPLSKTLVKGSTLELLSSKATDRGRNVSFNQNSTLKSSIENSDLNHSSTILSSLIEHKNNTAILNSITSSVQNYLDYRHNETQEKLKKYKSEQMKKELQKCTSKPVINKNSIKIAKNLNKNSVERLYRAKLEKNNEHLLLQKQKFWEAQNTFSPNINEQSKSLTRTVDDLYSWNDRKENTIQLK